MQVPEGMGGCVVGRNWRRYTDVGGASLVAMGEHWELAGSGWEGQAVPGYSLCILSLMHLASCAVKSVRAVVGRAVSSWKCGPYVGGPGPGGQW